MRAFKPQPLAKADLALGFLNPEQPVKGKIEELIHQLFVRKISHEDVLAQLSRRILEKLLLVVASFDHLRHEHRKDLGLEGFNPFINRVEFVPRDLLPKMRA